MYNWVGSVRKAVITMSYNPKHIANYFIDKGMAESSLLTPIQAIKLVYIAHGWYLAAADSPLIDEVVEAWKYGPVIPSLYQKLKRYRKGSITEKIEADIPACKTFGADTTMQKFLDWVWDAYKLYTGIQLAALTHAKDTPWWETVSPFLQGRGRFPTYLPIDNELIKKHYKQKFGKLK